MWKNDGLRGDTRTKRPIFSTAKSLDTRRESVLYEYAKRNRLEIERQAAR
jgi:hypothetical protein